MNKKILTSISLISFLIVSTLISSCQKDPKYGEVEIYIDRAMFETTPEFYYNGSPLQHSSYGDIWVFEANVNEKEASIDYAFYFEDSYFSSIEGIGLPVILEAPEDGDVVTNTNSYELRPTGDLNEPFMVFDITPDDGGGDCFIGTWAQNISSCNASGAEKVFHFNSDGTGYVGNVIIQGYDDNCVILCNVKFYCTWEDLGGGSIQLNYTDVWNDCGQNPNPPSSSDILNITCNGSSLDISGQTYTKK